MSSRDISLAAGRSGSQGFETEEGFDILYLALKME